MTCFRLCGACSLRYENCVCVCVCVCACHAADDPAVLKAEQSRLQTILDRVLSDEKKWPAGPKKGTDYAYDTLKELHERRKNALR